MWRDGECTHGIGRRKSQNVLRMNTLIKGKKRPRVIEDDDSYFMDDC
jgi:hypothetical protein